MGKTALQAVQELDSMRGNRTLPQLHRTLQPKGRKKKGTTPLTTESDQGTPAISANVQPTDSETNAIATTDEPTAAVYSAGDIEMLS